MNAMRNVWLVLAAAVLMTAQRGGAAETAKPAVKAKDAYQVYGGLCSRSWRLLGTYDNLNQACWAAAEFREKEKLRVEVTLGSESGWVFGRNAKEFRVYRNPCKGFALEATLYNAEKATAMADAIKKDGDRAEIVYVFAKK